ncbi:MAG TPA: hypothetical protein DCZ94_13195 [Lentisphaeria bacterium]|nr:hypothetical protein [Lentisphaeria bacterium]
MNGFYLLLALLTGGIALFGMALGVLGVLFMTVPFGIICGSILGIKFIGPWASAGLVGQIYSSKSARPPPPEFPVIRVKILNEQYAEAISDLKALLEKDPGNYHVILLLVEIFVDKTDDHENAIGLISAYLKKDDRCIEDVPIVMKLVDVYLELEAIDKARDLLKKELGKKYPKRELEHLRSRLDGI